MGTPAENYRQSLMGFQLLNSADTGLLIGKGSAHAIPADFYKVEDCKKMAAELARRESKLDVLVNNSGSNWGAPFSEVRAFHLPTIYHAFLLSITFFT